MRAPRRGGIRRTLVDPVGTARVAKRLAEFVRLTSAHLEAIPDTAEQTELNERANDWAGKLMPAMGIDLHVHGREYAREAHERAGALLASNHRSYVDILALLAGTPCCFLAKDDVADWPVLGKAAVRVGTVFVERDQKDSRLAAREAIARLMDEGHTVAVFPEGTTYRGPGCGEFRPGAFRTAAELGVPVLPVAIEYPRIADAWQDEGLVPHFNGTFRQPKLEAHLTFGPLLEGDDGFELVERTQDWVDSTLRDVWSKIGKG